MNILVTGSRGFIGHLLVNQLMQRELQLTTFDRTAPRKTEEWRHIPGDLRSIQDVRRAMRGMDMVIHLGAIADSMFEIEEDVFAVNVEGTHNIFLSAAEAGVSRVILFSSVNATSAVGGLRKTEYFPIDDKYPCHPMTAYQLSKHLSEEIAKSFAERYDITSISLRPVFVSNPERYPHWKELGRSRLTRWGKEDYWSYVDVRDVCDAVFLAMEAQVERYDACLLSANDTTMDIPTLELMSNFFPNSNWVGHSSEEWFKDNPYRSVIDCSHAKEVLNWEPRHSWRDPSENSEK